MSMRINGRIVLIATLGVAALAGGSAFTASNVLPATQAGYGSSSVTGATAKSINYGLSADGTQIVSATVVFAGDVTGETVAAGWNGGPQTACALAAYDATGDSTTATCSGYAQSTSTATSFDVAVHS